MLNYFRREFLLGIAVGFILSAILVYFFSPDQISDNEIIERAARLGMVMEDREPGDGASGDSASGIESGDAVLQDVYKASGEVTSGSENQETSNPADEVDNRDTGEQSGGTAISGQDTIETVQITIQPGMSSESIARLLESKGVVTDREEFYDVVTVMDSHQRFRAGTFDVPAGGDMREIVLILTGRKKS
ncbi:MAG: hypothetical protein CVU89_12070 [Firmicutes bacterium HGW-Firmicutes-14]|nr:MAG: hypothetical protein CVU89_12070 [Firmicutes bacterium HGW-Firmicutes-14]